MSMNVADAYAPTGANAAEVAKRAMSDLLQSQRLGQYVEYVPLFSRIHFSGFADSVGLVKPQTFRFFNSIQGDRGAGFDRNLEASDTVFRSGSAQMPAGQEFVGFYLGVGAAPEAPPWIQEAFTYYGTLRQKRGPTTYEYGQVAEWTAGDWGLQAKAASTTLPNSLINQATNGSSGYRQLPKLALIPLPSKQPVEFSVETDRGFYATTNGQPTTSGSVIIDNTGDINAPVNTYEREICGTAQIHIWGFRFSLPG